jgi:hypothetical protein
VGSLKAEWHDSRQNDWSEVFIISREHAQLTRRNLEIIMAGTDVLSSLPGGALITVGSQSRARTAEAGVRLRTTQEVQLVKRSIYAFVLVFAVMLSGGQALAHHSFAAEFDADKPVTLKGIVVKWEMMNPHGWITVDVTGPNGEKVRWMVETSNPNGLMRLGWTKNSLKPGDQITVEAYKAKDGSNTANAARVTLADGRSVFAGSSGTPPASGTAPQ